MPDEEIVLDRNADGIVVLTGGTSRVTDALELPRRQVEASGCSSAASILGPPRATYRPSGFRIQPLPVVLRRSRLFGPQHARAMRSKRAAGSSTAAFTRSSSSRRPTTCRARSPRSPTSSRRRADPVPGGRGPPARRAVVVEQHDHPAGTVGIFQIPFRQGAHAVRLRDRRVAQQSRLRRSSALRRPATDSTRSSAHCRIPCPVRPFVAVQSAVLCEHHRAHDRGFADDRAALKLRCVCACCAADARSSLWLLRVVAASPSNGAAREKIPEGACIVACKRIVVLGNFRVVRSAGRDPTYVLKRELMWLPLFGWLAQKSRMIPIDRNARVAALGRMAAAARRSYRGPASARDLSRRHAPRAGR